MTYYGRICSQQQSLYYNQYLTIYSKKLRIEYKKKREDRDSNRVCGKNEKYIIRSRNSIKKGPGRDEAVSR